MPATPRCSPWTCTTAGTWVQLVPLWLGHKYTKRTPIGRSYRGTRKGLPVVNYLLWSKPGQDRPGLSQVFQPAFHCSHIAFNFVDLAFEVKDFCVDHIQRTSDPWNCNFTSCHSFVPFREHTTVVHTWPHRAK